MLGQLRMLAEDDPAFIQEMLAAFAEQMQAGLPELGALVAARQAEAARRMAHALKGAALNMGARTLALHFRNIEEQPPAPADWQTLEPRIGHDCEETIRQLNAYFGLH